MFGYLRIFSIVSLIAVLVIAGLIGIYFRSLSGKDLVSIAEQANVATTDAFYQSVWRPNEAAISANYSVLQTQAFKDLVKKHIQQRGLERFVLFDHSGRLLFLQGVEANRVQNAGVRVADFRTSGKKQSSEMLKDQPGLTPDGKRATLVRTLSHVGNPMGTYIIAESYLDITPQWNKIVLMQWVISGSIVTVFIILMWILILTSTKAEAIIAKQHEANTELAAAAAVAQAENQQKSLFLANISHELRTPLNAIIGFSEIIQSELVGVVQNERYTSYINDIHNAGVHLLSLINDILDFSKAEAGKLELEIGDVNASKLVENCIRLVTPRAEGGGIQLINAMPKETLVLATDSKKLKQILLNLLSNAVKFTPSGGQVTVSAWRNVSDGSIGFEVKDTGIGIAPKDISRAMQPFGQVDNTLARKYEGTGLGLPLTKKFIEIMGGEFSIQSQLNVGTTITFTLPETFKPQGEIEVKQVA